jgi:probable HAF family extracellular repeat protein
MRRLLLFILLTSLVALPMQLTAQQLHYTVTDLGTVGGTFSLAGGFSNSGWVEGYSTVPGDTASHAVLWRFGVIKDLGTLGGPNSDAAWRPGNTGNAAGGAETGAVDPYSENFCGYNDNLICLPFFWRNSTKKMTALPTLGGNNGWAAGINDQDEVTGNAENTTQEPSCAGTPQVFQFKPVLWIRSRIHALPTFTGDPVGQAFAINNWGQATGWSGSCTTILHGLLWQNGKAINLGTLGGPGSEGVDINNWGQVAGSSDMPDGTYHAFRWQRGVMTDLGTLPSDVSSSGDGINNWGQVVGGSYDASGNNRAFIWQNGVMTDLNALIPADSPLYLLEATGTINDRGQIAGYALVIATGEVHAFLLTPTLFTGAGATAASHETVLRPHVTVPESARRLMQRRLPYLRLKGGAVQRQ